MKPLVSLITPTHRTDKLYRLYESIAAQTDKRFEWIVVSNGTADVSILPKKKWIKIVPYTDSNLNIGALKKFGFSQGKGDLLAEVDHDDELMPHCVESLIKNKDKADFLYSDNIVFDANNEPYVWGPGYGWVITTYNYKGKDCLINKAFPPLPTNFAWQWWAPNHIRVWNREFYHRIGGHDCGLKACDDGDLICRTMIEGTIYYIEDVLYVYYLHPQNSHANTELQGWIQTHTRQMYCDYVIRMAESWSVRNNYNIVTQDNIFNPNIISNSTGVVLLRDLHLTGSPEQYMTRISDILVPGGLAVVSNSTQYEVACKTITEKNLQFWDSAYSKFSFNGSCLEGNNLQVTKNNIFVYFTKHAPGLHLARAMLDYTH